MAMRMSDADHQHQQLPSLARCLALLLFVMAAVPWAAVLDTLETTVLGLDVCGYASSAALPLRRPRQFAALASAMDAGPPPRRLA